MSESLQTGTARPRIHDWLRCRWQLGEGTADGYSVTRKVASGRRRCEPMANLTIIGTDSLKTPTSAESLPGMRESIKQRAN